jgi:hypothetical protein
MEAAAVAALDRMAGSWKRCVQSRSFGPAFAPMRDVQMFVQVSTRARARLRASRKWDHRSGLHTFTACSVAPMMTNAFIVAVPFA